jgi:CheY-like chemotaxis protein
MEASVSRVTLEARRVYLIVLRDLSALQQMEQAVYEARKTQALGALAGGIAHDFNNVLAAVISQIDLVLHAPECPPGLKEHLIYAQTSARRGAELVHKLQAFGRRGKPVFEPVDVMGVVEQLLFVLRRGLDPKIVVHCPPPSIKPWLARADANQILQALLNLGVNGRDAMPHGGTLTVTVENVSFSGDTAKPPRHAGEFVRVRVADTGHGMAPEVASRVFEPYFSTKDPSRGPGLGLSITASVVADHGGWMEVESDMGRGSRFSVFLPRSLEAVAAPKRLPGTDTRSLEGKERVLVVDDEELVRLVTKAVLAYRGYQVTEAGDGKEAVEKYAAAAGAFDLVLMDLHMPRLNGFEALKRIRELNPRAKAIVLSGGVHEPEDRPALLDNVAFLHKPFENQELLRQVRRMLDTA